MPDIDHTLATFVQQASKGVIGATRHYLNAILLLKMALTKAIAIGSLIGSCQNEIMKAACHVFTSSNIGSILDQIDTVINQDIVYQKSNVNLRNQRCYAVKAGCNGLLDVARQTYTETIEDVNELVRNYADTFQLNLRVKFVESAGFVIHMLRDEYELLLERPQEFINYSKKQKYVQFTTLKLISLNNRISESLDEVYLISDKVITSLIEFIQANSLTVYRVSEAIALLDLCLCFADICTLGDFVKPEFTETLGIKSGLHPLIKSQQFVKNDTFANLGSRVQIITGPNHSGKTTYLNQVALIVIMAHIGAFVPAEYAAIRPTDRILSRIGSDNSLEANTSSFTVEMRETAYILQNVTPASLIIIDELGRGTCNSDGLSLCMAVIEELLQTRAFTFFATHFQELPEIFSNRQGIVTLHLQVSVRDDNIEYGRAREDEL
jgi:DNA mismatch repair protein MSH4